MSRRGSKTSKFWHVTHVCVCVCAGGAVHCPKAIKVFQGGQRLLGGDWRDLGERSCTKEAPPRRGSGHSAAMDEH